MKTKNNSKGKFTDILGLLICIILGATFGFLGGGIISSKIPSETPMKTFLMLTVLVMSILISSYLQVIIHEGGHLICGRISGYEFISFRIGNIMFLKENGVIKRKKFNIVGTGGQCLMAPPQKDSYNFPYVLYNLGGVISNLTTSIIAIIIYKFIPDIKIVSLFLIIFSFFGLLFAILNGIPMKLGGIANDGYNILALKKSKTARHAFWSQLQINALLSQGIRVKDIDKTLFPEDSDIDLSNVLSVTMGIFKQSYYHDLKNFKKAKELSEFILESSPNLLQIHKNELLCELLFYNIMEDNIEKARELYTKELKKYIKSTSSYVSRKRLMYAYELLVNKNIEKAKKELDSFEKVSKTYPYVAEIQSERELLELIKSKSQSLI